MTKKFTPIKPRATRTTFRGHDGALIDIPGMRGIGIFIHRDHLDRVLDELDHIAATTQEQQQ